ncbi:sensor domain-containing protein [Saccharopolyspora sp. CA-218241]|uniref:sensor domain-containing protein n=1 Tax=Saccharopolyspora sp. CA-218241 TaxID=3240027 RepID=UPI003D96301A
MTQSQPPDEERFPHTSTAYPPPPDWGPPPPSQPSRVRRLLSPRGRHWVVLAAVQFAVIVALVGWLAWPAAMRAIPGTVQASVLTPEEASEVLGVTLHDGTSWSEPPPPLGADPAECAVAVGPATRAVYAPGWSTFHAVTYQDSAEIADHVVIQVLGEYPERDAAAAAFGTLAEGVGGCGSAVRTATDRETSGESVSNWVYEVYAATPDRLIWIAFEDDGNDWACFRQARLDGSSLLQAAVCQGGDGAPAAQRIAERFFSRAGA